MAKCVITLFDAVGGTTPDPLPKWHTTNRDESVERAKRIMSLMSRCRAIKSFGFAISKGFEASTLGFGLFTTPHLMPIFFQGLEHL